MRLWLRGSILLGLLLGAGASAAGAPIADVELRGFAGVLPHGAVDRGTLTADQPTRTLSIQEGHSAASAVFSAEERATDGRLSVLAGGVIVRHDRNFKTSLGDVGWYVLEAEVRQDLPAADAPPAYACAYLYRHPERAESGALRVVPGTATHLRTRDGGFAFTAGIHRATARNDAGLTLIVEWGVRGHRELDLDHGRAPVLVEAPNGLFRLECVRQEGSAAAASFATRRSRSAAR